jgi:hypothetical protein
MPRHLAALTASLLLTLPALAQAAVLLSPSSVMVSPGQVSVPISATLTFGGAAAPTGIQVLAVDGLPPGVTTQPSPLTYVAGPVATAVWRLSVGAGVPDGTYSILVRDTSKYNAGSATLLLVVATRSPVVRSIVPGTVAAGGAGLQLRLIGSDLPPGAQLVIDGTGVSVQTTRVVSPTLAEAVITVAASAPSGARGVRLVTPDGVDVPQQARLVVLPPQSAAAAASVTTVAIVSPATGAFVTAETDLHPHALIACAGAGTIVGSWLIDGVVFDRFTLQARGALPLRVTSRVPLPLLVRGEHRLELAVEHPQQLVSRPVFLTMVVERDSALRILAPRDGISLSATPPLTRLRWSPVPGATGYEVRFRQGQGPTTRLRVAATELTLDGGVLKQIGEGLLEWSVAPLFPGEVVGEPCVSRTVAVAPKQVTISELRIERDASSRVVWLRWKGAAPGVVFRIEILAPGGRPPDFTGLSRDAEYRLPAKAGWAAGPHRIRVTALGPSGELLGVNESAMPIVTTAPAESGLLLRLASQAVGPTVTAVVPSDGATLTTTKPRLEAYWTGFSGASPDTERSLSIDGTDASAVAEWTEAMVGYEPPIPLAAGAHQVVLRLGTLEHKWSFTVEAGATDTEPSVFSPPPTVSSDQVQWNVTAEAATTLTRRSPAEGETESLPQPGDDTLRAHLSGLLDVDTSTAFVKASGDLAVRHDFHEPEETDEDWLVRENRSWLLQGGVGRRVLALSASVGYGSPDFVDQAEILTAGMTRGGVQGKLRASWLSGSYYRSFEAPEDGLASGFSLEQDVSAFAFELSRDPAASFLRAIQLHFQDPSTAATPQREATVRGVLARLSLPQIEVWLEAARSTLKELEATPAAPEQTGSSLRGRLAGRFGTSSYSLALRRTGRDFVNPANGGFTAAAMPGWSGEADFTHLFASGTGMLALQAHHLQSPVASDQDAPDVSQNGGNASLSLGLGRPVSFVLGTNALLRRGDEYTALSMPETDARDLGASAMLTETVRTFSFTQTFSYQASRNFVDPLADSGTLTGSLMLNGSLRGVLTMSAAANWTRVTADPAFGDTEFLQISVQPMLSLAQGSVTLQALVLYSKMHNTTLLSESRSEQYGGSLSWTPPFLRSFLALQVQADWSRTLAAEAATSPFRLTLTGNLTLRWGSSGSHVLGGSPEPLSRGAVQARAAVSARRRPT